MSKPAGDHGIVDAALAARFELYHGFPTIKPSNPTGLRQVLPPGLTDITTKKLSDHRECDQLVGMLSVMLTAGAVPVFPPESAHNAIPRGRIAFYGDPNVDRIVCKTTKHAMCLFRRRIQTSNGVVLGATSNQPTPFSSQFVDNIRNGGKSCLQARSLKNPKDRARIYDLACTAIARCRNQTKQGSMYGRRKFPNEPAHQVRARALRNKPFHAICLSCGRENVNVVGHVLSGASSDPFTCPSVRISMMQRHTALAETCVKFLMAKRKCRPAYMELPSDTNLGRLITQGERGNPLHGKMDAMVLSQECLEMFVMEFSVGNSRDLFGEKTNQVQRYVEAIKTGCAFPTTPRNWQDVISQVGTEAAYIRVGKLGPNFFGYAAVHPAAGVAIIHRLRVGSKPQITKGSLSTVIRRMLTETGRDRIVRWVFEAKSEEEKVLRKHLGPLLIGECDYCILNEVGTRPDLSVAVRSVRRMQVWQDPAEALYVAREWDMHWPTNPLPPAAPPIVVPLVIHPLPIVCDCLGTALKETLGVWQAHVGAKWCVEAGAAVLKGTYAALSEWKRAFRTAIAQKVVLRIDTPALLPPLPRRPNLQPRRP